MTDRILLTGGTGLVGIAILKALLSKRFKIFATSRNPPTEEYKDVEWVKADLSSGSTDFLSSIPPVRYVIHGAAFVPQQSTEEDYRGICEAVNSDSSERLFSWCSTNNVEKAILLSTYAFLRKPLEPVIHENHPMDPQGPYALSKYQSEQSLMRHARDGGYLPVALRLSSPVPLKSQQLHNNVLAKWIQSAREHKVINVFGTGLRCQDFVSTSDIAQAVLKCLSTPHSQGIYNIGSGRSLHMEELATIVAKSFSADIHFSGVDVNENDRSVISIEKARTELAYQPTQTSAQAVMSFLSDLT